MKKKIIFVCSANVFRSMSAELFLKKYLEEEKIEGIEVVSRGIKPPFFGTGNSIKERLKYWGLEVDHVPKQISEEDLEGDPLILGMNQNHLDFLKEKFGLRGILFDEFAFGVDKGIQDDIERFPFLVGKNNATKEEYPEFREYVFETIDHIREGILLIVEKLVERPSNGEGYSSID